MHKIYGINTTDVGVITRFMPSWPVSTILNRDDRIERLEFDSGVLGCERPIGLGLVFVAVCAPGCDLATKTFEVADAAAVEQPARLFAVEHRGLAGLDDVLVLGLCASVPALSSKGTRSHNHAPVAALAIQKSSSRRHCH